MNQMVRCSDKDRDRRSGRNPQTCGRSSMPLSGKGGMIEMRTQFSEDSNVVAFDGRRFDIVAPRAPDAGPPMSSNLKVLIGVVLVGFGILHIIGGHMIERNAAMRATETIVPIHKED
jgi:hypothetical protein